MSSSPKSVIIISNMIAIYWVLGTILTWTHGADGADGEKQVVWTENPCSDQHTRLLPVLHFCVPVNKIYTFQVPYDQLQHRGVKMSDKADVKNDIVYAMVGQLDNSWENEVVNSGNQWVPKATTKHAKEWFGKIVLIQTKTHLSMTVDMKRNPDMTICTIFRLHWYVTGKDPYFDMIICSIAVAKKKTVSDTVETVGMFSRQSITVIDMEKMKVSDFIYVATGVNTITNTWVRQALGVAATVKSDCVVCMAARPQLLLVNALPENATCAHTLANKTSDRNTCTIYQTAFPKLHTNIQPPIFTLPTDTTFTCYRITTCQPNVKCTDVGRVPDRLCNQTIEVKGNGMLTTQRQDVWWWCGGNILRGHMEASGTGSCAYVSLIWPATIVTTPTRGSRGRRDTASSTEVLLPVAPDTTYMDAIGVPRGVPDEYKLVDQIATGFENLPLLSAVFPVTPNKNVDRINYLNFQVQRLTNITHNLGENLRGEVHYASLVTWQTRTAVDMLLAEKGGVCSIFGDQCCTFIPNNTAAGGSVTHTLRQLRAMSSTLKEHSGVHSKVQEWLNNLFGKWTSLIVPFLTTLVVVIACFVFCGCCCIPLCRSIIERTIERAVSSKFTSAYALIPTGDEEIEIGNYYSA